MFLLFEFFEGVIQICNETQRPRRPRGSQKPPFLAELAHHKMRQRLRPPGSQRPPASKIHPRIIPPPKISSARDCRTQSNAVILRSMSSFRPAGALHLLRPRLFSCATCTEPYRTQRKAQIPVSFALNTVVRDGLRGKICQSTRRRCYLETGTV